MASSIPPSEGWKRNRRKSGSKIQELREEQKTTGGPIKSVLLLSPVRLLLVWALLIFATLGLGFNLYRLQIANSSVLLKKARQQQMVSLRPFVPRRSIVDRNGNFLATDQPSYKLYAHPKLFKVSKQTVANQLSKIINVPEAQLLNKLNQKNSGIRLGESLRED